MNLAGKRALVTGAAGFIGSHLVEELVKHGANVTAFVHYNSGNSMGFLEEIDSVLLDQISVTMGDLKDPHGIRSAVEDQDYVFHLGALIAIPYSYMNPTDVVQTNVLGTLNVAQACKDFQVKRLIHTSTSEVYGTAQYVPMDEAHPLQGQSPYSASKIAADKVIESFYCSYDLPVVTVRPFNSYGPRQSMRAVIPTIIQQALFKNSIQLGNTNATRDFTFVEDTARAFVHAALANDSVHGEVFNAGSGFEISIDELAQKIKTIVGRDIPIEIQNQRIRPPKSEVNRLYSDSSKAKNQIGWETKISLDEGLSRTINYIQNNKDLYRHSGYVR